MLNRRNQVELCFGYVICEDFFKKFCQAFFNIFNCVLQAVDLDDYTGNFCGKGKYPLINAALRALNNQNDMKLNDLNELAMREISVETSTELVSTVRPDNGIYLTHF